MKFGIENIHRIPFRTYEFSKYQRSEKDTLLCDGRQWQNVCIAYTQNVLRSSRRSGVRRYPNSQWHGVQTNYFKYTAVIITILLTIIKPGAGNDILRLADTCQRLTNTFLIVHRSAGR